MYHRHIDNKCDMAVCFCICWRCNRTWKRHGMPMSQKAQNERMPEHWLFRCEKCKTEAKYAAGIGHYCPNPKCENADYGIGE